MCYAIPGQVSELENHLALVDYFGEKRKVYNEFPELKVGDYVYAQGGYIIKIVPEKQAQEVLEAWKETFFELRETDLRLSRFEKRESNFLLDKVLEDKSLSSQELLKLLKTEDPKELNQIYRVANFLRQKYLKNACCVHGILEFSNYCQNDCFYCGLGQSRQELPRYRMKEEEILQAVEEAVDTYGFKALVLQSGEDPEFRGERLVDLVKEIKKRFSLLLILSVGEVGEKYLLKLYEAGARGWLMRFETSNPALYAKLHPQDHLENRLQEIKLAQEMGYLLFTGGLIGLPGQTLEDIRDDILLTKELKAEMYSFGPVLPGKASLDLVLKVLALCRLVDPKNAKIVVTTALETLHPEARRRGLLAGANSLMLNVSPLKYRKLYRLYDHRAHAEETIEKQIKEALDLLYTLGRAPTDLGL